MSLYAEAIRSNQEDTGRELYIDLATRRFLVGSVAVEQYALGGATVDSVHNLGDALTDESIAIPRVPQDAATETKKWSRGQILARARSIVEIVESEPEESKRSVNQVPFLRAAEMGFFATRRRVRKEFGSYSGLYKELELESANYKYIFDDWSTQDFVNYVQQRGAELGKRPTEMELWDCAHEKPWENPSPYLIARRVGKKGRLGNVMELAGYADPDNWNLTDYRHWGVRFMKANPGLRPTRRYLEYLSPKGLSPSCRAIMDNFGLSEYQKLVEQEYEMEILSDAHSMNDKLDDMNARIATGYIPAEIFDGIQSLDEKLKCYGKYLTVKELRASFSDEVIIRLARGEPGRGFISSIRKPHGTISAGEIESVATMLGYFDYIWPPEHNLDLLVIPEEVKPKPKWSRQRIVEVVVAYIDLNGHWPTYDDFNVANSLCSCHTIYANFDDFDDLRSEVKEFMVQRLRPVDDVEDVAVGVLEPGR